MMVDKRDVLSQMKSFNSREVTLITGNTSNWIEKRNSLHQMYQILKCNISRANVRDTHQVEAKPDARDAANIDQLVERRDTANKCDPEDGYFRRSEGDVNVSFRDIVQ